MGTKQDKKTIVQLMGDKFPDTEKRKQSAINAAFRTAGAAKKKTSGGGVFAPIC